jgi:hypothetical protein
MKPPSALSSSYLVNSSKHPNELSFAAVSKAPGMQPDYSSWGGEYPSASPRGKKALFTSQGKLEEPLEKKLTSLC